jgi:hypothetical protein
MMALGILAFAMIGSAGPLVCDAGCVANAEDAHPAPKSDRLPIPAERETAWDWAPEPRWRYMPEYLPRLGYQRQRGPLRGDFWPPKDFDRAFQDIDRGFRPGR